MVYRKHKSGRGKGKTYRMNRTVRRGSEVSLTDGKVHLLDEGEPVTVGRKQIRGDKSVVGKGKSITGKGKSPYSGKPKSIFGEGKKVTDY